MRKMLPFRVRYFIKRKGMDFRVIMFVYLFIYTQIITYTIQFQIQKSI